MFDSPAYWAAVNEKFDDLDYLYDIGDISLNISGCMNSCGHHHVANIGILGVDKNDEEWYQITIGGQQGKARAAGAGRQGSAGRSCGRGRGLSLRTGQGC